MFLTLKEKANTWDKEALHFQKYKISLMQKLLIKGKKELSGSISISGSKNAALPILAASILGDEIKLSNVPLVKDIFTMLDLLKFIGMKVKVNKKILCLKDEKSINTLLLII